MARPSGEKTRCSGKWTEAKFNSFIKNLLRQGTRKWGPIQEVKSEARTRRGFYRCACCTEEVPATILVNGKRTHNVAVDHITPIISVVDGFENWDLTIEGMFAEKDNLQVLCLECHTEKSNKEREIAAKHRSLRKDNHPEYNSWKSMRARCLHEYHHAYPRYGGRGITICDEWEDFWKFKEDMGPRPEDTTLDRIDNNGNYEPGNCRWATHVEQANNRNGNVFLEVEGECKTLSEWSRETGIPIRTITNRKLRGDCDSEALNPDRVRGTRPTVLDYEAIYQRHLSGKSFEEIADEFSCHRDTVRKYIQKRNKKSNDQS